MAFRRSCMPLLLSFLAVACAMRRFAVLFAGRRREGEEGEEGTGGTGERANVKKMDFLLEPLTSAPVRQRAPPRDEGSIHTT